MKNKYTSGSSPQLKISTEKKLIQRLSSMLLLFALLGFGGLSNAQTVTIGAGTTTNSNFPLNYNWGYNYSQTIYTAAEMVAAGASPSPGTITKIRFKPTAGVSTEKWQDWVIYLGNTTKTNFASTTDWVPVSSMTEVFNSTIASATLVNQWLEITLTTTFPWDGTSNIVVALDENTSGYGGNPLWAAYTLAPSSGNKGIYYRNDGTNPNPTSPPTASGRSDIVAQIQFFGTLTPPCTGTPSAGTVPATLAVCAVQPFNLVATGATSGQSGLTGQWQFRTTPGSGVWQDLTGATTSSYTVSSAPGTPTEYRYSLTCSGNTGYSNSLTTSIKTANECYCTPTGSGNNTDEIRNFTLSNLNNNSAASEGTNGYSNYTTTVSPAQLESGASYAASLTSGLGGGSHGAAIWIDTNQNGIFEASEMVAFLPSSITASTTATFPLFTVSGAIPAGTYRLRVQYHYSKAGNLLEPCVATSTFSETEDYAVTVFIPSCSSPSNLTVSAVGSITATISWDAPLAAPANGYEYYLSQTNTAPTAITVATGTTGAGIVTENLTSLSPSTEYFVWVRSFCSPGNKSTWSTSTSFTTQCNSTTIPYSAPISATTGTSIPTCMTLETISGNAWKTIATPLGFGGRSLQYSYNSTSAANSWIFTQGLELTAGISYRLTYQYGNNNTTYTENLRIKYGTSPNEVGMSTLLADHPSIQTSTPLQNTIDFTPTTTGVIISDLMLIQLPIRIVCI